MASTADIRAGGAFVELYIRRGPFDKGLRGAQNTLVKFGQNLRSLGRQMAAWGAGAFTAMFAASKTAGAYADEIVRAARITSFSAETLQGLKYAANQAQVPFEELTTGIFRMQQYLGSLSEWNQSSVQSFLQLGLGLGGIKRMRPEEQWRLITDRIMRLGTVAEQSRIGMEIMGRNFKNILPLLREGSKATQELVEESQRAGLVLSAQDLYASRAFSMQLRELWASVKGTTMALGSELLPILSGTAKSLTEGIQAARGWIREHGAMVRNILIGVGAFTAAGIAYFALGRALAIVGWGFERVRGAARGMGVVLSAAFTPLRWLTGGAGAVASFAAGIGKGLFFLPATIDAYLVRPFRRAASAIGASVLVMPFRALSAVWFANVTAAKAWHKAYSGVRNVIVKGLPGAMYRTGMGLFGGMFRLGAVAPGMGANLVSPLLTSSLLSSGRALAGLGSASANVVRQFHGMRFAQGLFRDLRTLAVLLTARFSALGADLAAVFAARFPGITRGLRGILSVAAEVPRAFAAQIPRLLGWISGMFGRLGGLASRAWATGFSAAATGGKWIAGWAAAIGGAVYRAFRDQGRRLFSWLSGGLGTAAKAGTALVPFIASAASSIGVGFTSLIASAISDSWKIFRAFFVDVAGLAKATLLPALEAVLGLLKPIGQLLGSLGDSVLTLGADFAPVVLAIGAVYSAWTLVSMAFATIVGTLKAAIASVKVGFQEMRNVGSAAWSSLKGGAAGLWGSLQGFGKFFRGWGDMFMGVLGSIGKHFGQL